MTMSLPELNTRLKTAKDPESIFGLIPNIGTVDEQIDILRDSHRKYVKIANIDANPDHLKPLAVETFKALQKLYQLAIKRIRSGIYGTSTPNKPDIVITNKKNSYTIGDPFILNEISNIYHCKYVNGIALFKIIRNHKDNDLAENDYNTLKTLNNLKEGKQYFPNIIDSFVTSSGSKKRRATVLEFSNDYYTLSQIIDAYPNGIDQRDAAWMLNRILEALWFAHNNKIIHGAILPNNILLNIKNHGINLIEWAYSVKLGSKIKAVSNNYKLWYPPEVLNKSEINYSVDLYMAANCAIKLLGGDPSSSFIPDTVHPKISRLLRSCIIKSPFRRSNSADLIRSEFNEILKDLFGPRKFRHFAMP